jgi:hypothetical protein
LDALLQRAIKYAWLFWIVTMTQDKFDASEITGFVLEGTDILRAQARDFELSLEKNPDDLKTRAILLGYYETRHLDSAVVRRKRQATIWWFMDHLTEHPFLQGAFGLPIKSHDERFYEKVEHFWCEKIAKNPGNVSLLVNAAAQTLVSNPSQALKWALEAKSFESENANASKVIERIKSVFGAIE